MGGVSVYRVGDDDDELVVARHGGYVPNVSGAAMAHGSDAAFGDCRLFDGRRDPGRRSGGVRFGSFRPAPGHDVGAGGSDRADPVVGLRTVYRAAGAGSVPHTVHGAGCVGRNSGAPGGTLARFGARFPAGLCVSMRSSDGEFRCLHRGRICEDDELRDGDGADGRGGVYVGNRGSGAWDGVERVAVWRIAGKWSNCKWRDRRGAELTAGVTLWEY